MIPPITSPFGDGSKRAQQTRFRPIVILSWKEIPSVCQAICCLPLFKNHLKTKSHDFMTFYTSPCLFPTNQKTKPQPLLTPNGRVIWEMRMMEIDPNTTLAVREKWAETPSGLVSLALWKDLFFWKNFPSSIQTDPSGQSATWNSGIVNCNYRWWFVLHPSEKYYIVKLGKSSPMFGVNIKHIWVATT